MKIKNMFILILLSFTLGACVQVASTTENETITVNDTRGEVEVPVQPKKVAVFDNGTLDTLKVLGAEEAIIGAVTQNPPAYLAGFSNQYENIGTLKEPNVEKLAELAPDLIIVSNRMADFVEQLEEIAPVLWLSTSYEDYWDSVKNNIETLGKVFSLEEEAEVEIAAMETKLAEMKGWSNELSDKAFVLMLNDGAISAFSTGSRFGFIFSEFGFTPVDAAIDRSTHGQTIGYEGILEINPDILFVVDRSKAIQSGASEQMVLLDNDFIKKTNAYQKGQIVSLSSDLWYLSGGGLESLNRMMEEVQANFMK